MTVIAAVPPGKAAGHPGQQGDHTPQEAQVLALLPAMDAGRRRGPLQEVAIPPPEGGEGTTPSIGPEFWTNCTAWPFDRSNLTQTFIFTPRSHNR